MAGLPGSAACNQTGSVTGLDINEIQLPGAYLLWVAWPLFLKTLIFSAGEHFTWDVATRGKCLVLYRRLANERGGKCHGVDAKTVDIYFKAPCHHHRFVPYAAVTRRTDS